MIFKVRRKVNRVSQNHSISSSNSPGASSPCTNAKPDDAAILARTGEGSANAKHHPSKIGDVAVSQELMDDEREKEIADRSGEWLEDEVEMEEKKSETPYGLKLNGDDCNRKITSSVPRWREVTGYIRCRISFTRR